MRTPEFARKKTFFRNFLRRVPGFGKGGGASSLRKHRRRGAPRRGRFAEPASHSEAGAVPSGVESATAARPAWDAPSYQGDMPMQRSVVFLLCAVLLGGVLGTGCQRNYNDDYRYDRRHDWEREQARRDAIRREELRRAEMRREEARRAELRHAEARRAEQRREEARRAQARHEYRERKAREYREHKNEKRYEHRDDKRRRND